jgi:hypothetical protein
MYRRQVLKLLAAGAAGAALQGCTTTRAPPARPEPPLPPDVTPYRIAPPPRPRVLPKPAGTALLVPHAPVYPYWSDRTAVIRDAQGLSDALARYVDAWFDGRVSAEIPDSFIPPGVNRRDFPSFRLVRPDDVAPEAQWSERLARPITREGYVGFFPDPHVTYLVVPAMYLPFGHRVVIEGEFPHARFFDVQVTPSFRPEDYHYDGGIGVGEVPIVDADIDPLPGHTNPFLVGADRRAARRGYRVEYEMAIGDPVDLNPAFRPPYFRDRGNHRYGGGIVYQGAWGAPGSNGHGRGQWDVGQIWIRYYGPDRDRGPYGGVPLPRVTYVTPDGREYYVLVDLTTFAARANRVVKLGETRPAEPSDQRLSTGRYGWIKQTGIFRAVISGIAINSGWAGPEYVRDFDRGVASRGEELTGASAYEQSATSATYVDYLSRGMELGRGKVVVLTGRLPSFPTTLAGAATMTAGEMRYWSLTGYHVPTGLALLDALSPTAVIGLAVHSIVDEDLVLDASRRYVLVLSRPGERPRNATRESGATWVDWGPSSEVSWTLRWLTVGPEWTAPNAPTPQKLGRRVDWPSPQYDARAIGENHHHGALGEYLPRVHYLSMRDFEALGERVTVASVPPWT